MSSNVQTQLHDNPMQAGPVSNMSTLPPDFVQHPSVIRYLEEAPSGVETSIGNPSLDQMKNHILCGDALEVLTSLPNDCVDLVHTSPPYNIDRPYEMSSSDKSSGSAYLEFLRAAINQLKRVLRPGGSIFWQTGCTQESGSPLEIVPIDLLSYELFREEPGSLLLWDRIIWRYWGGHAFTRKFTNKHETILWFVKLGAEPVFEVDNVRERAKEYDKRNNFWGRNPGNVWEVDRVAFGSSEQTSHIAVFPEEISERIVWACSRPGSFVLDPFSGSGTVPKVAHGLGRDWLGIEISPVYAAESAVRIDYQQPNEADSFASELMKQIGFSGKKGVLPLGELHRKVCNWLETVPIRKLREAYQLDVDSVFELSNGRNLIKRDVWAKYDRILGDRRQITDPIRTVDSLLLNCYKLRQRFNGVSRYNSALRVVESLEKNLSPGSGQDYLRKVLGQEPSSFRIAGESIEFLSTSRNVFAGPDRPGGFDAENPKEGNESALEKQLTL